MANASVIQGPVSTNLSEVDSTFAALRVSPRPLDCNGNSGGAYRITTMSGAMTTVAAAGPVWSLRWTNTSYNCLIWVFKWYWVTTTAFGTAQALDHSLYIARQWTAADSAGATGAQATITGDNCKKRTANATTKVDGIFYGTTGVLTAGTRTLDPQPIIYRVGYSGALNAYLLDNQPQDFKSRQEGPIQLMANEGLVLQNTTLMGATGVIKLVVECAWTEVLTTGY
jgi:hypothetical protein